ncbi:MULTISPECIES: hypothetical protein [Prochlorococcus]|uniref:hypothetical protein n=1 Tax=Prochlorococcus TaxID=1218 RepID=UPI0005337DB5|nr:MULTISPECIES: hypothetical protein [Prochlorococcus]KGG12162.1 hypothetical protein EV05_1367 [Prochlorococcus sp. MIT 0601]
MNSNENKDLDHKHRQSLDQAQDQRLDEMFHELELCNIENMSEITHDKNNS